MLCGCILLLPLFRTYFLRLLIKSSGPEHQNLIFLKAKQYQLSFGPALSALSQISVPILNFLVVQKSSVEGLGICMF